MQVRNLFFHNALRSHHSSTSPRFLSPFLSFINRLLSLISYNVFRLKLVYSLFLLNSHSLSVRFVLDEERKWVKYVFLVFFCWIYYIFLLNLSSICRLQVKGCPTFRAEIIPKNLIWIMPAEGKRIPRNAPFVYFYAFKRK